MYFVDTNVFIRYLTGDDPEKAKACLHLFQRAKRNKVAITTSAVVVAELVYVLSSKQVYALGRKDIHARLYPLLSLPGLKLSHRKTYLRALDLYASYPIDFEDAVIVAEMEQQKTQDLYSYDQGFDRIDCISRVEP